MELAMRIVVVVFAALMTLGLVALGVVVVQTGRVPDPVEAAARVSSPQNTVAKGDKAPLDLGKAVKAAALYIDRRRAEQHDGSSFGSSSFHAGADTDCCVQ